MKTIRVKDFCRSCVTRGKGREFYNYLRSLNENEFEFDFSDTEYISSSFLDETVWRLAEENFRITILDPDNIIEKKLNRLSRWTKSRIRIRKTDKYLSLAG
jgi:hypothetical protein